MGGVFKSPSPPAPEPLPPEPEPEVEDDDRAARIDALNRRRRGRAGTIATSHRGVLELRDKSANQKRLLGE